MKEKSVIYTIGHSSHKIDFFIELLKEYNINCIIDVRTIAASAYNPQYNKEALQKILAKNNICYLHFAKEFGARHTEPKLLDSNGVVDFEKVRNTEEFRKGVERVKKGIEKGYTIALMCSESEPLDCHRFSMVSLALSKEGFDVRHIMKDKTFKTNDQLEYQLLKKYDTKLPKPDMFHQDISIEDQLLVAYRLKNKDIGYNPHLHSQSFYTELI